MGRIGTGSTVRWNGDEITEVLSISIGEANRNLIDLTHMKTPAGPKDQVLSRFYDGADITIQCNITGGLPDDAETDAAGELIITVGDSDDDAPEFTFTAIYRGDGKEIPNEERATKTLRFTVVADSDSGA